MRLRGVKQPKQMGYVASNLVTVPVSLYNNTNISIGLINCQSIGIKSGQVSDVFKDMYLDVVVITETWLTINVSDQEIIS